jgi:hypothetical protein
MASACGKTPTCRSTPEEGIDPHAPDVEHHFMFERLVSNCFVLRLLIIGVFAVTLGAAKAEPGIVTWKEQAFHADASAKAFYFESMKQTGLITWFYHGDRRISFERHQPFDFVLIPGSLTELNGKTTSDLKSDFENLSGFAAKYPAAGVMLKARLDQMGAYLKNYQAGEVYVAGKWRPLSEYEKIIGTRDRVKPVAEVAPPAPDVPALVSTPDSYRIPRLVTCAAYLVGLLFLVSRGKRRAALLFLLLPLIAAFGWFTYEESGLAWTRKMPEKMKEIPGLLGWPGQAD